MLIIENENFRYGFGEDGINHHFTDKISGFDYLYKDTVSYCAYISVKGKNYPVSSVSLKNNRLKLKFHQSEVTAEVTILRENRSLILEVISIAGDCESLNFLNIPLRLKGEPSEHFAACALSLNIFTRVSQLPPLQTNLWAACYKRFGITGAKVAILGVPQKEILTAIRGVISHAKDIPFSNEGGAWALLGKEGYGSYLMNFGTLTEQTVDDWIKMCKSLGFTQIDSHGSIDNQMGNAFFRFGDFKLNPDKWPEGWKNFERINKRLSDAGISHIFHTYAFFIDKNSAFVTPVPSPDLGYIRSFTIAENLSAVSTEIITNESTAGVSTITGWRVENSNTVRIGEELVTFSDVTRTPPYKLTGCKRGAYGTFPSSYKKDEKAFHLKELFGLFVPQPDSRLFIEVAKRTAEIVNKCNFKGIYLDAIDGSQVLDGEENSWYYGTKFIFDIAKHLVRPVGMEMSSMAHHWWHYRSRWQAWDRPHRGYKRFEDIHLAAMKTDEYEHGHWKGNTPLITKYAQQENGRLMLPLHLGWWGHQTWDPPQNEPTFTDDVEYLCCKMIGNNAGLSMLGCADESAIQKFPIYRRLNEIIRQYEALRNQNYFSDSIRRLLRIPGREYTLFSEKEGSWNLKPITYNKHKVAGLTHSSVRWMVNNEFKKQPVKLRIELLMSVKQFDSPENMVLADFKNTNSFIRRETAPGVSGTLLSATERSPEGAVPAIFSAKNSGDSPQDGSWINMEKIFNPAVNLKKNQGIGVWVKGDGSGQLLNIGVRHLDHLMVPGKGDHFIPIDFVGWKYFELVEYESVDFSNFLWPGSGKFNDLYVYQTYRNPVILGSVDRLQLWYNNLPVNKSVQCQIGQIKALPLVSTVIHNPAIVVGNQKLSFPVTMESGMYIEYDPGKSCILYGTRGEVLKEFKPEGEIPLLNTGNNVISFLCNSPSDINTRVQVTVISEGEPLKK